MLKTSIRAVSAAVALAFSANGVAAGVSDDVVKIGVLGDMSGMYSSGFSGPGAVAAVRMAVQNFGGSVLGKKIEVVYADHQNKADIASATARQWFDTDKVVTASIKWPLSPRKRENRLMNTLIKWPIVRKTTINWPS